VARRAQTQWWVNDIREASKACLPVDIIARVNLALVGDHAQCHDAQEHQEHENR
jgi:hypothetical protein